MPTKMIVSAMTMIAKGVTRSLMMAASLPNQMPIAVMAAQYASVSAQPCQDDGAAPRP